MVLVPTVHCNGSNITGSKSKVVVEVAVVL